MTYLSMSTPTDVVIMHCPITANRPINPISWSEIEKGRKLLTITLNHEPRTPYQAHKFSEQNFKKTLTYPHTVGETEKKGIFVFEYCFSSFPEFCSLNCRSWSWWMWRLGREIKTKQHEDCHCNACMKNHVVVNLVHDLDLVGDDQNVKIYQLESFKRPLTNHRLRFYHLDQP